MLIADHELILDPSESGEIRPGSGFDIRESRWHAPKAGFDFRVGVGALPAPETTEGGQPSHAARHSHGSHLLAAGMEITAVSARLGHSSVRVTADVYSHAIRGRDDEAARRWEEFQGGMCLSRASTANRDSGRSFVHCPSVDVPPKGTCFHPSVPNRISRSTNSQMTSFLPSSRAGLRLSSCRTKVDAPPSSTIEAIGILSCCAR